MTEYNGLTLMEGGKPEFTCGWPSPLDEKRRCYYPRGHRGACHFPAPDLTPYPDPEPPKHYLKGGQECKNLIRTFLIGVEDPWLAYLLGTTLAYIFRHNEKDKELKEGEKTSLEKARDYLNWSIEASR